MFNSTYVRDGDTNNNIDINSVSGTLVKNYRNSFFYQCKEGTEEYGYLFDPENPRIYVTSKIKNAIEKTGYTPSIAARSLNSKGSHLIGVIIGNITNTFANQTVKGIEDFASENDYLTIVASSEFNS